VGQGEYLPCHRAAFTVVGTEQDRAGPGLRCGERKFPAKVCGVLDGGVHPLAGGRRIGVGGVPGQVQPSVAEPFGDAVLQSDPRGPGKAGDLRAQVRLVDERLQFGGVDCGAWLPGWQLIGAGGPGREQAPGRPLAEREREQQSLPPGHDMGGAAGEISIEFGIGQHDLHRVSPPGPSDASLGPHGAGRSVAAGDETEQGLLRPGR